MQSRFATDWVIKKAAQLPSPPPKWVEGLYEITPNRLSKIEGAAINIYSFAKKSTYYNLKGEGKVPF